MRRLILSLCSLLIILGLIATSYVSYRHYLVFRKLPRPTFSPQRLTLPLSLKELPLSALRWVEVQVTPAAGSSPARDEYRDTVEAPHSLILQFSDAASGTDSSATGPRKVRGILYTAVNRSRPGASPEPLIRDLNASGILPNARFAVLMVGKSPWLIWKAVLKEGGVLVSGLLIALALIVSLIRSVRALWPADGPLKQSAPDGLKKSWVPVSFIAAIAFGWAMYLSLRTSPVLPAETVLGLGLGAGLSLFQTIHRHISALRPSAVSGDRL